MNPEAREPSERGSQLVADKLETLVGLFGIGKNRTDEFLDRVQQRFEERGLQVQRFAKPTNARTAPPEVMEQVVKGCDVVLVGLSD